VLSEEVIEGAAERQPLCLYFKFSTPSFRKEQNEVERIEESIGVLAEIVL
jgi:hypothetical protein